MKESPSHPNISMTSCSISLVVPNQPFRYQRRLLAAFSFARHRPCDLYAAGDAFDGLQRESGANARTRRHGRNKTQAVQSVVDPHLEITVNLARLRGPVRQ